ncbi:MAG: hypothetical protein ACREVE_05565 [Gammaproteobacteria bacterium]
MLTIFITGLLVLIVGLAMLFGAAFRRRLLAGLAVMLVPVSCPVYAFRNWSNADVRNGFLTSLAGILIVIAAVYGGVVKDLPFTGAREIAEKLPTALPPDEPLPNAAAANAIMPLTGATFDPLADERYLAPAKPLSPQDDKRVLPVAPAQAYAYYALAPAQVAQQVGKTLRIVTREGKIEEGTLTGGDARSLLLETPRLGGSVAFEYTVDQLVAIYVYDREPPEALPDSGSAPESTDPHVGRPEPNSDPWLPALGPKHHNLTPAGVLHQ